MMLVPTTGLPMQIHAMDGAFTASPISGRIHELVEFDEAPVFAGDEASGLAGVNEAASRPRLPR
jgi:hypothetical protein